MNSQNTFYQSQSNDSLNEENPHHTDSVCLDAKNNQQYGDIIDVTGPFDPHALSLNLDRNPNDQLNENPDPQLNEEPDPFGWLAHNENIINQSNEEPEGTIHHDSFDDDAQNDLMTDFLNSYGPILIPLIGACWNSTITARLHLMEPMNQLDVTDYFKYDAFEDTPRPDNDLPEMRDPNTLHFDNYGSHHPKHDVSINSEENNEQSDDNDQKPPQDGNTIDVTVPIDWRTLPSNLPGEIGYARHYELLYIMGVNPFSITIDDVNDISKPPTSSPQVSNEIQSGKKRARNDDEDLEEAHLQEN